MLLYQRHSQNCVRAPLRRLFPCKFILTSLVVVSFVPSSSFFLLFHLYKVDLGGGTFDVSVVDVSAAQVETVAIGGDPRLGGGDFDDR